MKTEVNPKDTTRGSQFEIWKNAPNPMLVFVKKLDVTSFKNGIRVGKKQKETVEV